jgi:hypothetical protein
MWKAAAAAADDDDEILYESLSTEYTKKCMRLRHIEVTVKT